MRAQLRCWNATKGYGFATLADGSDLFVHISAVPKEDQDKLKAGAILEGTRTERVKGPALEGARVVCEDAGAEEGGK